MVSTLLISLQNMFRLEHFYYAFALLLECLWQICIIVQLCHSILGLIFPSEMPTSMPEPMFLISDPLTCRNIVFCGTENHRFELPS